MTLVHLYERALCSDRCPDALAALGVLLPVLAALVAILAAIVAVAPR